MRKPERTKSRHNHHSPCNKNKNNYILSTYFTKDRNSKQHCCKRKVKPNNFNLIKDWYNSIVKLNLNAIIFHNECSNEFIKRYQTEKIKFVYYDDFNRISYNDERFYCFRDYLLKNNHIENIFSTDAFDVEILRNPFNFINDDYELYAGSEKQNSLMTENNGFNKRMRAYRYTQLTEDYFYNAGISGGSRETIIEFYNYMIKLFDRIHKKYNSNMVVFNEAILQNKRKWKVYTGYPLHNKFKSRTHDGNIFIKHK